MQRIRILPTPIQPTPYKVALTILREIFAGGFDLSFDLQENGPSHGVSKYL